MQAARKFLFGGHSEMGVLTDATVTASRIMVGLAMATAHGWGKIPPPDRFIEGVANLGFPAPSVFAWSASLAECLGGLCLAAGLLTRPSALAIVITMGVAHFIQHGKDPFDVKELSFLYLAAGLVFVALGSGRFGVDRFFRGGGSGSVKKSKPKAK